MFRPSLTPEELALSRQRQLAREARTITAAAVAGFLRRQNGSADQLNSEGLEVDSVQDLFVLDALYREAALQAGRDPETRYKIPLSVPLPAGVHLHFDPGLRSGKRWIIGQSFVLKGKRDG